MLKKYFPHLLLVIILITFTVFAFNPNDRAVWFAENSIPMIAVAALILTYKKYQFSNLSYFLMAIPILIGIVGGHYTFSLVPFDFVTDLFGFQRNNYDRFAHFLAGVYAYPFAEFITKKKYINSKPMLYISIFSIITMFGALYEVLEWLVFVNTANHVGVSYFGDQGDSWDTQKDMALDSLGAVFGLVIYGFSKHNKNK